MSVLSHSPDTSTRFSEPRLHRPRRRWIAATLAALVVVALGLLVTAIAVRYAHDDSRRRYLAGDGWPAHGQAAYTIGSGPVRSSPGERAVPIASVAKVMTAYL